MFLTGALPNMMSMSNWCAIMFHCVKTRASYWLSHKNFQPFQPFQSRKFGNDNKLCPLYFSEKPDKKSVSRNNGKITFKKMQKSFLCDYLTIHYIMVKCHWMSVFISLMLSHQVVDSRFTWYTSKLKRKIKIYIPKKVLHFPKKVLLFFRMDADLAYLTSFDFFPKKFLILDHSPRTTLK